MIFLRGIKTHNLKDLTLSLPKAALICFTGPSGSGKSSLAFDTLFVEARRRYLEALNFVERHFLPLPPAPPLEEARGLPPAIGLEQKLPVLSSRSTVGTISGIWNYLRILFAELGVRKCFSCNSYFEKTTLSQILEELLAHDGAKIYLLAPLYSPTPAAMDYLQSQGFSRFWIDGQLFDFTEEERPPHFHEISILVDRLVLKKGIEPRLREGLKLATSLAGGVVQIYFLQDGEVKYFTTGERCPVCGKLYPPLEPEMFSYFHLLGACPQCQGFGEKDGKICPSCEGRRLKPESLAVSLGGKDFFSLSEMPLEDFFSHLQSLRFDGLKARIFEGLSKEIQLRVEALLSLDLHNLELNRLASHLSLGELQRLRLATLFAERLAGCLYILDEPSLGLSPQDKEKLLFLLRSLVEQGNTVLIVEHDPLFITASDEVLELGPGAGERGGKILFQGPPEELVKNPTLPTGAYLSGKEKLKRRPPTPKKSFEISNFMLSEGILVTICGPSGAGKTTILKRLAREEAAFLVTPASSKGRDSIVISYIEAFRHLRELLASTKTARILGLKPASFSFYTSEGRCPVCRGAGKYEVRVKSLPPLTVRCEECLGRRFRPEVLQVTYRGYNVAEILELTVEEALHLFGQVPSLAEKLKFLGEVGLSYLRLGQELKTLSGGELQRLHLARLVFKKTKERVLLFDVPSLGLHLRDIQQLLDFFDRLLAEGFTVVVADNHPAFVLLADEIWEIKDGKIAFQGPPKQWLSQDTGFSRFYRKYLSLVDISF